MRLIAAALALAAVTPAAAQAAAPEVVSPVDGAVVSSRPVFTLAAGFVPADAESSLNIELSESADLQTAGSEAGQFVDAEEVGPFFRDDKALDLNSVRVRNPIAAGDYYWHTRFRTYDGRIWDWSPVRRFTVEDEPVILTGWAMRAQRLRPKGNCRTRVQLIGKATFEDNERQPNASARVTVGSKGFTVRGLYPGGALRGVLCTKSRKLNVGLRLTDDGGNRSKLLRRTVGVRP